MPGSWICVHAHGRHTLPSCAAAILSIIHWHPPTRNVCSTSTVQLGYIHGSHKINEKRDMHKHTVRYGPSSVNTKKTTLNRSHPRTIRNSPGFNKTNEAIPYHLSLPARSIEIQIISAKSNVCFFVSLRVYSR